MHRRRVKREAFRLRSREGIKRMNGSRARLFRENGHRIFMPRSKADVITSSTHGRAPERRVRSPGTASTGFIGPSVPAHAYGRLPFDIEMLFLQYVVSSIIENSNAFSDRPSRCVFIYSAVFHQRFRSVPRHMPFVSLAHLVLFGSCFRAQSTPRSRFSQKTAPAYITSSVYATYVYTPSHCFTFLIWFE